MAKRKSPYKFAVWALRIYFSLLLLYALFFVIKISNYNGRFDISFQQVKLSLTNVFALFFVLLPLLESIVYQKTSRRKLKTILVKLHIWLFILSFLFPLIVDYIISFFIFNSRIISDFALTYWKYRIAVFWILFISSQIFFIAAVIKAFTSQKENEVLKQHEPADFLNEFSETNQRV